MRVNNRLKNITINQGCTILKQQGRKLKPVDMLNNSDFSQTGIFIKTMYVSEEGFNSYLPSILPVY